MKYTKVKWIHHSPSEPIWIHEEIDVDGWEQRKVEMFADGSTGRASKTEEMGDTRLADIKVPPLSEIASDPQFEPSEISANEFEEAWIKAKEDS